jgi:hypothetical protein
MSKTAHGFLNVVDKPSLIWRGIVGIGLFFLVTMAALWVIYSMGLAVNDGKYTHQEAVSLVSRMALVTTGLALSGVMFGLLVAKSASPGKLALRNALLTGFFLAGYTVLNVMWREGWQPDGERSAFLPPWSELNGSFFYEYNWLSYLLFLTPVAMTISACITFVFAKFASRRLGKIFSNRSHASNRN